MWSNQIKFLFVNLMLASLSAQAFHSLKVWKFMKCIEWVRLVSSIHRASSFQGTRSKLEKACTTSKQSDSSQKCNQLFLEVNPISFISTINFEVKTLPLPMNLEKLHTCSMLKFLKIPPHASREGVPTAMAYELP